MNSAEPLVLRKAAFNPVIRPYIVVYIALILGVTVVGIPLMLVWLLGVGRWYARHYFDKLECELTERTLRFKKGILVQVEKTIPLENIQDVTFIEGPLLKHFNLCILKLETAGHSDPHSSQMNLIGIMDAPAFRSAILARRREIMEARTGSDATAVFTDIRDTLLRIEQQLKDRP